MMSKESKKPYLDHEALVTSKEPISVDKLMALHKEKETEIEKERTKERRNYPILRQSI